MMRARVSAAIVGAKSILASVLVSDASVPARGRRAHARALATIEAAERLGAIETQLRIANLIALTAARESMGRDLYSEIETLMWPDAAGEQAA